MKDCKFKDSVIDYIEGLLDGQDRIVFENHLKECKVCQKEFQVIKKIYGIMDNDKVPVPNEESFAKIRDRVRQQEITVKKPLWKIWSILVPVLGVLIFILIFSRQKEQSLEISVSISNLSQDQYINALLLDRIIDDEIVSQFNHLEEYFYIDVEQNLNELTVEQNERLIEIIKEKYGEQYL